MRIENIKHFAPALESTYSTHPETHIVWKVIFQNIFPSVNFESLPPPDDYSFKNSSDSPNTQLFSALWNTIIVHFFSSESHQKKYLGFQLVESLIEHLGKEEIKLLFSGAFTNCLRNHLSSPHRFLNAAVKHLLNKIIRINDKLTNEIRFELLKQFYEVHKNMDGVSKVKVVENLITKFDGDTIKKYIQFLKEELVKSVKKPHL